MKRLRFFAVFAFIICTASNARAYDGFVFPVNDYMNHIIQVWGHVNANYHPCGGSEDGIHVAEDVGGNGWAGTDIVSAGDGYVKYVKKYGWCDGCVDGVPSTSGGWGWIIIIEYDLPSGDPYGTKVCAIYGHVDPNSILVSEGQHVSRGSKIAKIGHHSCWTDHLHFGMYKAGYGGTVTGGCGTPYPKFDDGVTLKGYLCSAEFNDPGLKYIQPSGFINRHLSSYHCAFYRQDPTAADAPWLKPGDVRTYTVSFTNNGVSTWKNVPGLGYVELWSAMSDGTAPTTSLLNATGDVSGWISDSKVGTMLYSSVAPGQNAWWTFTGKVPTYKTSGQYPVYFRPWIQDASPQLIQDWAGMNFLVKVDADQPTASRTGGAAPGTYATDQTINFAISDTPSGPKGFSVGWDNQNVPGPNVLSSSGSTTLGAGGTGTHTLYIRAWDNAGNIAATSLGVYTYNPITCESAPNLSFDTPNGSVPCGWTVVNLNGAGYGYADGGAPGGGTKYVSFTHVDGDDWNAIGRSATSVGLVPDGPYYRLGFWYRASTTSTVFSWRLGDAGLTMSSELLFSAIAPASAGSWTWFSSPPFRITSAQLSVHPDLVFYFDYGAMGTIDIDNVIISQDTGCGLIMVGPCQ